LGELNYVSFIYSTQLLHRVLSRPYVLSILSLTGLSVVVYERVAGIVNAKI
jgi:hypothetical protein